MVKDNSYHKKYREEYKSKVKYITIAIPLKMYEELEKLSVTEEEKISPLIRKMAWAYMREQTFVPKEISEQLREFALLIRGIANNINQMAHHSNTLRFMTQDDENNLLMELKKIEDLVKEYTMKQLKK
jgi:hypothetical protein